MPVASIWKPGSVCVFSDEIITRGPGVGTLVLGGVPYGASLHCQHLAQMHGLSVLAWWGAWVRPTTRRPRSSTLLQTSPR